jgi:hypothetical protein
VPLRAPPVPPPILAFAPVPPPILAFAPVPPPILAFAPVPPPILAFAAPRPRTCLQLQTRRTGGRPVAGEGAPLCTSSARRRPSPPRHRMDGPGTTTTSTRRSNRRTCERPISRRYSARSLACSPWLPPAQTRPSSSRACTTTRAVPWGAPSCRCLTLASCRFLCLRLFCAVLSAFDGDSVPLPHPVRLPAAPASPLLRRPCHTATPPPTCSSTRRP